MERLYGIAANVGNFQKYTSMYRNASIFPQQDTEKLQHMHPIRTVFEARMPIV
jgi:hypothetical protein